MRNQTLLLNNVTKTIKGKQIIKGISFSIEEGEILGFLGPNGAGKSTTLRMIAGLSTPTSGEIEVCGHSINKNYVQAMSNVGCIIEGPDLYNYMSGSTLYLYIPTHDLFKYNLDKYLSSDNFHPNAAGYDAISKRIFEALKNYTE